MADKTYERPVKVRVLGVRHEKDTSASESGSEDEDETAAVAEAQATQRRALAAAKALAERNIPATHPKDSIGKGSALTPLKKWIFTYFF